MELKRARWLYAVEIESDFKGLNVMRDDIEAHFERHPAEHAVAFERPAKLIVRFEHDTSARFFWQAFSGRFITLSSKVTGDD
jgi:hypothetical protein